MTIKSLLGAAAVALATTSAASAATLSTSGTSGAGEIATFEFTLGAGATFLDITTNGSTDFAGNNTDTMLALYSGTGPGATKIVSNDDSGIGGNATITFGVGSGMLLGDYYDLGFDGIANGEFGALPAAGVYTAVIGRFYTDFTALLGDISAGGNGMNYELSIFSDGAISEVNSGGVNVTDVSAVPLPAGGMLLISGLAGVAALKRRKNRAA